MPWSVGRRSLSAQNVEIAVICADFEISIGRSVPLVQHFLDHVLVPVQPKANRPFVRRSTGIAIHLQLHLTRSPSRRNPCKTSTLFMIISELTVRRSANAFCRLTQRCLVQVR